ncbi:glycosyltransferase [Nocardia thailandica]|uniref:glycosyltransferase n=1 Tax=Nocardia thailandica TaxID=257275 RepID=UPI0002E1B391|nr:glycosyltransferase [Nocardia thailandica]
MSRVLFVGMPLLGHLFPMLPLAGLLRARGHTVAVATGAGPCAVLGRDLPVLEVGPPIDHVRAALRGLAAHPVLAVRSARGMADARGGAHVFAVTNRPLLAPLTRAASAFAPDVIVHEPFAAAAAIVAERLGVPTVLHNIAFDDAREIRRELLAVLGHPDLPEPETISVAPPSMVGVPGLPMRFTPYALPGDEVPEPLRAPPRRPRLLVTRSTMLGDGPDAMLRAVLRAAPGLDADIVVVRPNRAVQRARRLPPNVSTTGWLPLTEALRTATALVGHGGAGSVYAALCAGVPQLVTPAPGDRAWNARLVARRGAGLAVPARRITAARLHRLLHDPQLVLGARAVAAEIAAMPDPSAVADRLFPGVADRPAPG